MVATDETSTQNSPETAGGTFGKLKQTLSSSLLTAQDKGIHIIFIHAYMYIFICVCL